MARLRCLFRIRLAVARSSMASWLWVLANWLETRCKKFWRILAMRACSRSSWMTALERLRTALGARDGLRVSLYPAEPASQRPGGVESGDVEAIGRSGDGKG